MMNHAVRVLAVVGAMLLCTSPVLRSIAQEREEREERGKSDEASTKALTTLTNVQLEQFLKDAGFKVTPQQVPDSKRTDFVFKLGKFDAYARMARPDVIWLFASLGDKTGATLERVNRWNSEKVLSRAVLFSDRVHLEADLNGALGVTPKKLGRFVRRFQDSLEKFEKFLKNEGGDGRGPEAAPTPEKKEAPNGINGGTNSNAGDLTTQAFPAKASAENCKTSWDVRWDFVPSVNHGATHPGAHLLRIVSAEFKFKDKSGKWKSVMVVRNMQLAEAFSAYDDGWRSWLDLAFTPEKKSIDRRADLTVHPKPQLEQCILAGETLSYSKDAKLKILREVHDDGLRWMTGYAKVPGVNKGYRGEKLVLLAGFQALNYVYLTEYDFTDDGRIVCRLGFTAHNNDSRGGRPNAIKKGIKDGDVHLHVGCWRMDFDLGVTSQEKRVGGPTKNNYRIISRRYDPNVRRFTQVDEAFGGGSQGEELEGKAAWKAEEFTTLRVQSADPNAHNSHGRRIAYDLIPSRFGSVRGLLPLSDVEKENMDFVNYEFWITRTPPNGPKQPYHKVPELASKQQSLIGQPATAWYSSPALHVPRGEDFGGEKGTSNGLGVALTTWIEFTLRPRDVFDSTPLYP